MICKQLGIVSFLYAVHMSIDMTVFPSYKAHCMCSKASSLLGPYNKQRSDVTCLRSGADAELDFGGP